MKTYRFRAETPFQFHFVGKFICPTREWMHQTRRLWDYELFVVTRGTLHVGTPEESFAVHTGQYLLMPPTQRQQGLRPSDCDFYWLHFMPPRDQLQGESADENNPPALISFPETGDLRSPERMWALLDQLADGERRYGLKLLNDLHTTVILTELSAQHAIERKYLTEGGPDQLCHDIMDFITINICTSIRVADVARYFGYNEKYLTTLFRRASGMSLKQFILQQKMERAKAELMDTDHSVAQIGYNIGYTDPHNFSNAFKRVTGLAPSEYREGYARQASQDSGS